MEEVIPTSPHKACLDELPGKWQDGAIPPQTSEYHCKPLWATAVVIQQVTKINRAAKSHWMVNQHNVRDVATLFHAPEE